ncbi:hypothetical protein [Paenibacillus periandrae]|uniref:hypothetical protein n=1 Tax=Paenibacillus periandrae TaxID=1761741 RepID=UPI001F090DEB|nr:hypothetical protein [Paenibacillus periandrae]
MAKIYPFPSKQKRTLSLHELFFSEDVEDYYNYFKQSDNWQHEVKPMTLYDGYPNVMACTAPRGDMVWYVNYKFNYGTWLINKSNMPIVESTELIWGWSPFVRKSVAPVHEPLNLTQKAMRHHVTWIVDEGGYGQYGLVTNKGELWVPHPRPDHWRDHNNPGNS